MTPAQIAIARRLVASPWWPYPVPSGQIRDDAGIDWIHTDTKDWCHGGPGWLCPDLTDAATGGVLLARLSDGRRVGVGATNGWSVVADGMGIPSEGQTLAHAAALALLEVMDDR